MENKYPVGKHLYTIDGRACGNGRVVEHQYIENIIYNIILFESGATATLHDNDVPKYFHEQGNCGLSIEMDLSIYSTPHKVAKQAPGKTINIQKERMKTWRDAFAGCAMCENATKENAIRWADAALDAFDKKFNGL